MVRFDTSNRFDKWIESFRMH